MNNNPNTLNTVLTTINNTLNIANKALPLYKETKPMFKTMKNTYTTIKNNKSDIKNILKILKVKNEIKKENINNNNIIEYKEIKTLNESINNPTFFI